MKPLRPEFIQHASPDAIRAELAKAQRAAAQWERRAAELSELLTNRLIQIKAGRWPARPKATPVSGAADEPDGRGEQRG